MLRLFFLAIVIYLLLRLVRRVVSSLASGASAPRPTSSAPQGPAGSGVIDEMKRCPTCGTYNPTRLAYRKKDLYFCNDRCHEDFNDGKKAS